MEPSTTTGMIYRNEGGRPEYKVLYEKLTEHKHLNEVWITFLWSNHAPPQFMSINILEHLWTFVTSWVKILLSSISFFIFEVNSDFPSLIQNLNQLRSLVKILAHEIKIVKIFDIMKNFLPLNFKLWNTTKHNHNIFSPL